MWSQGNRIWFLFTLREGVAARPEIDSSHGILPFGASMERFAACFAEQEDPREANARHDLHDILLIGFCTMLCRTGRRAERRLCPGAQGQPGYAA